MSIAPSTAAARSFSGDRDHSSFGFAVRHMTVSTFRGSFSDVTATAELGPDGSLALSGAAAVESISVKSPLDLRNHLLSDEFFDAARHPQITFASERAQIAADGSVTVEGSLTIRNISRPVVATGTWTGPIEDPYGATRAALELTATIDRRDYGMAWNMPLPRGGDALGTQVTLSVHLELIAD